MASGFRLLAYAIVALAVIALVYQIMGPLLFPLPDNLTLIERSLKASETGLGITFSSETYFQEEEGFSELTFNRRNRNVSYQCINPVLCCPQSKECSLSIEWDNNHVKFNKARTVNVSTRCKLLDEMYACDVYIGEKPGQLEIDDVSGPKKVDFRNREEMYFDVTYSNTGNEEVKQASLEVKIFQRYFKEEKWEEKLVDHASESVDLGTVLPGTMEMETVVINLNQNGPFRAEITISGENGGFDRESFEFETIGAVSDCRASRCETPVFDEGKCTAKCYCQDCLLGSRCAELLKQADNKDLDLPKKISIADGEPDILGSNIVNMLLQDEMCPSDIVIEEASAVGNKIGFKVKNDSENHVRKSFEVKAFHAGTGNEIGSVTVLPEEINDTGEVIKTIEVNLAPGSYQVKLVANPAETELEANYENNKADVTVDIPIPKDTSTDPLLNPPELGLCCGYQMLLIKGLEASDQTGAISLRDAIESGKVKARLEGFSYRIYFSIQNITKEKLKIVIPFGQTFVPEHKDFMQNMAKGKDSGRVPSQSESLTIEVPVCRVYVGSFKAYCLNMKKKLPNTPMKLGMPIEDLDVLNALRTGSQAAVWNTIARRIASPSTFGSEGTLIMPEQPHLSYGVELTRQECLDAGIEPPPDLDCNLPPTAGADPDEPSKAAYDFYCDNP
jgi:hypothetical protein